MSRVKIIEIATKEIGYAESPPNSNLTKYGVWFGLNGVPWCAIFASWIYDQAGHPIKGDYGKGFASVPYLYQHAKKIDNPLPGSLIIYDWQKSKVKDSVWSGDHVGIFKEWLDKKAGTFLSIEGNTSTASDSNGGSVMLRQRNMAYVQAFVEVVPEMI